MISSVLGPVVVVFLSDIYFCQVVNFYASKDYAERAAESHLCETIIETSIGRHPQTERSDALDVTQRIAETAHT